MVRWPTALITPSTSTALVFAALAGSDFAGAGAGAGAGPGLEAEAAGAGAGFSSTELQAIASTVISVTLSGQKIVVTELFIRILLGTQLFRKLDSFR
jgi:hypothetical protein